MLTQSSDVHDWNYHHKIKGIVDILTRLLQEHCSKPEKHN